MACENESESNGQAGTEGELSEAQARQAVQAIEFLTADYHTGRLSLAESLLLPKAKAGELWAIQNLLKIAAEAIEELVPLTPGIASFLAGALKSIHKGAKADDALGIKRKRGEKDTRRAQARAYWMADAVERIRYHRKDTLENAIGSVAEAMHASDDTVKRGWKQNYKEVRRQLKLEEECFGKVMPILLP